MNSKSKYLLQEEACDYNETRECDCGSKVIFKSSCVNFGPLDVTFEEDSLSQTFNRPFASVSMDSTCLNCPNILIRFTGILNVTPDNAATSTLSFALFRICNGMRMRQPLTTFNFFVADIASGITASHTLTFEFATDNNCEDCCTYIMELTSISNLDFGTVTYSINGTFSALAIGTSLGF